MAEININSRIIHKHDIEANWLNKTFTPKQGEIIVYDIDANYNYERFKIGDGKTNVNSLPFVDGAMRDYVDTEIAELSKDIETLNTLVSDTSVADQIANAMTTKADVNHTHDDLYYTESEIDTKLSTKADADHTHDLNDVSVNHATTADTANAVAWENVTGKPEAFAAEDHDHDIADVSDLQETLDAKVPTTRKVNGKALSVDITLSAEDVGADAAGTAKSYTDERLTDLIGDTPVATQINTAIADVEEQIIDPNFYVTFTRQSNNTYTADKTYSEVEAAYVAGQTVMGLLDLGLEMLYHIPVLYCVTNYAIAFHTNLESSDPITIAYGADGTIVGQTYAKIASKTDITDAIAAIEHPVKSVNGKTGVVTLTASDLGAEAAGAAATAETNANKHTDTELARLVGDETVADQISSAVATKADSDHTHSSYVNQNAFANIKVGSTTVAADSTTDTLTLVGSNVTLTPDATNDQVTIGITKDDVVAALGYTPPTTNNTYSAAGSSLGLVKSGGDVTISSGLITVNDDSHNHTVANIDGLQATLDLIGDTAVATQISNAIANKADATNGIVQISNGGTGASSIIGARENLLIIVSSTQPTSPTPGTLWFQI